MSIDGVVKEVEAVLASERAQAAFEVMAADRSAADFPGSDLDGAAVVCLLSAVDADGEVAP